MNLTVITGDVIKSRTADSTEIIERLSRAIEYVNEKYAQDIRIPFEIVKGDEIAGVLKNPLRSYRIIVSFQTRMHPIRMRFVAVHDEVNIETGRGSVREVGGAAFWIAEELINRTEREKLYLLFRILDRRHRNAIISDISNLITHNIYLWNRRELKTVLRYLKWRNQRAVARSLGISQPAVHNILERTGWRFVVKNMELVDFLIKKWWMGSAI